jgi:WhiB family redox-sensing transcriptional regulator
MLDEDPMWWADRGACVGMDPAIFFPKGKSGPKIRGTQPPNDEPAKAVCAGCKVRVECLAYARRTDQNYGIWGGVAMGRS